MGSQLVLGIAKAVVAVFLSQAASKIVDTVADHVDVKVVIKK